MLPPAEVAMSGPASGSSSRPARLLSALQAIEVAYPDKVPVHLVNGHAYVWRVKDASHLRSAHHICGLLTGTLPLIPQQNVFLGLPLQLFQEEVVFLIRKRAIVLIADERSFEVPTPEELEAFEAAREADRRKQAEEALRNKEKGGKKIEQLLEKAAAQSRANSDAGSAVGSAAGSTDGASAQDAKPATKEETLLQQALEKRLQREQKRRMQALVQQQADMSLEDGASTSGKDAPLEAGLELFAPHEPAPSSAPQEAGAGPSATQRPVSKANYQHITVDSALEPPFPIGWYRPHAAASAASSPPSPPRIHETLSSALRAGDFAYPRTQAERARCAAFEDLQARGYYMGIGLRFGGDFVVYPGDPLRYHSHFTCTVRATPRAALPCMELIANGRLGTAVKKAHLFSGVSGARASAHEMSPKKKRNGRSAPAASDESPADKLDVRDEEDDIAHKWGEVQHYSLTWSGFGT